ncbi:uncharacterized protein LY89DRAFT_754180 [Mollisia scopiformis]|uniref:2EXR domain-containing protein n=1 Tax=Mollisia scopiformis TaxID=149040 RepID=A0A194X0R1_MOLSC|nr:uncharacterized protein LY89DRAFT_754180 [Mollisia scopiformis]KUJ13452.1 hypothetical protein LY89DRAFT_754180 [Mollisia scopiformis]
MYTMELQLPGGVLRMRFAPNLLELAVSFTYGLKDALLCPRQISGSLITCCSAHACLGDQYLGLPTVGGDEPRAGNRGLEDESEANRYDMEELDDSSKDFHTELDNTVDECGLPEENAQRNEDVDSKYKQLDNRATERLDLSLEELYAKLLQDVENNDEDEFGQKIELSAEEFLGRVACQDERRAARDAGREYQYAGKELYAITTWRLPTLASSYKHALAKEAWKASSSSLFGHAPTEPVEFLPFPRLPVELRLEIWENAIPKQRKVAVISLDGAWSTLYSTRGRVERGTAFQSRALTQVPAILHASRESREVALGHYKPCFGAHFDGNPVYFNISEDKLLFQN